MGPFAAPAVPRRCPVVPALRPCECHAAADAPGCDGRGWCQGPGACQGCHSLPREQGNSNVLGNTRASGSPPALAMGLCAGGVRAERGTSPWGPAHPLLLKQPVEHSHGTGICPGKCFQLCCDGRVGEQQCHRGTRCVLPHHPWSPRGSRGVGRLSLSLAGGGPGMWGQMVSLLQPGGRKEKPVLVEQNIMGCPVQSLPRWDGAEEKLSSTHSPLGTQPFCPFFLPFLARRKKASSR